MSPLVVSFDGNEAARERAIESAVASGGWVVTGAFR